MKPFAVSAVAGFGGVSVAVVGYAAAKIFGLGGNTVGLASDNALASPQSVPEPGSLLLLGAGLLTLALVWARRTNRNTPDHDR